MNARIKRIAYRIRNCLVNRQLGAVFLLLAVFATNAHAGLLIKPEFRWQKSNIKICFLESKAPLEPSPSRLVSTAAPHLISPKSYNSFYMQQVRSIIETEFNGSRTGVRFDGWHLCSESPDADAFVFFYQTESLSHSFATIAWAVGQPYIGFHLDHLELQMLKSQLVSSHFAATMLHEFGHLAGLSHEHQRWEYLTEGRCLIWDSTAYSNQHSCTSESLLWRAKVVPHGSYDHDSIMNYCRARQIERYEAPVQLSQGDKAALQYMFKGLPEN